MAFVFQQTNPDGWTRVLLERDRPAATFGPWRPLVEVWRNKVKGEDLPAWRDFSIRDLAEFLPWMEVYDILPGPAFDATVRYWGTMVTKVLGGDLTGQKISQSQNINGIDGTDIALLERVIREKRIGLWAGPIDWQENRYVTFTSLILPLADDGRTVDKLMLCIHEGNHLPS